MRLVLDEHYSPSIARQLRKRRHDVVSAAETDVLRSREDPELLAWAVSQRRGVVSENASDFRPIHEEYLMQGKRHYGIILTNARRFPRTRAGTGRLVKALDRLLMEASSEHALMAELRWLSDR